MRFYLKTFLVVICFICILLYGINAQDRVYTAVSTDGSPGFPDTGSWSFGNSFTNNSTINNSYSLGVLNPWLWDHNFAVYVYDQFSSTFVNNDSVINQANFNTPSNLNNFLNIGAWIGYNWVSGSKNSSITNNGNFTNILNLSNQNQGIFFNYSLYSSYSNPVIINNGNIDNTINMSNCNNIQSLYNFSMASYESQSSDILQNFGTINNILNVNNSQISFGVFNYSINSFSTTNNSLNVSIQNVGAINNIASINSSIIPIIRNHSMLVYNPNFDLLKVNFINSGYMISNLTLINSNPSEVSNDGIAIYNSQNGNVLNDGEIVVNTIFDSTFTGTINSNSGIYFENVDSGSIVNNGNISVLGNSLNNFSGAGIKLRQSGSLSPIQISTPNLMFLDPNFRSIILDNSNADLLSFGFYVDGDPTHTSYMRPILVMNSSNLNLNNTVLHLHVGNNIHLNKPYYIIENQNSNINGEFDPNFIQYFSLTNPNISVGWYNGVLGGDNVGIIFSYDPKVSLSNNQQISYIIAYRNLSDNLRDIIVNNYHSLQNRSQEKLEIGDYNFYEVVDADKLGFESKIYGKNIIIHKSKDSYRYGGIISLGKMVSNQSEYVNINYEEKSNYFGYGLYALKEFDNSYLTGIFHTINMRTKYSGYTGMDLSLEEKYKNNLNLTNLKIEYGFGKKSKIVLGVSKTIIDDYDYETQVINPLWIRRVSVERLESTEGYVGWDMFDKTQEDSYYFTIKFCQIFSGDTVSSYEELQGVSKIISQKIPENNLKMAMFYNTSSNLFLGLKAEINNYYQKYAIKIGKNY